MKKVHLINAKVYKTSSSMASQIVLNGYAYIATPVAINNRFAIFLYKEAIVKSEKVIGWVDISSCKILEEN